MKSYKRYLSVFVVCLLLFVTFSINASAESSTTYKVETSGQVTGIANFNGASINSGQSHTTYHSFENVPWASGNKAMVWFTVSNANGDLLAKKGENYKVSLNNIVLAWQFRSLGTEDFFWQALDSLALVVVYTDGSREYIYDDIVFSYNSGNERSSVSVHGNITAQKDISKFIFELQHSPLKRYGFNYTDTAYLAVGLDPCSFTINVQSEEAGLLDGLTGWIKNIFSKITDGFQAVTDGFSNVLNSIVELPSKLWDLISEGLKNLFVPDEEYMSNFSDKWYELLSQRFGSIYQVGSIITDFVERIQMTDKTNTIHMPVVSLESVGIPFSFGGYDVQIVPNGFDTVVEICKKIISIVCTFLFINGLRKKYDEVMGVKE